MIDEQNLPIGLHTDPHGEPQAESSHIYTHIYKRRLDEVQARIAAAAARYHRDENAITLLAVSKQQSSDAIQQLAALGVRDFGESYLQEALTKQTELKALPLVWHYIGQLQANKTRAIAEQFTWVHTIDRLKIAQRLNEQRPDTLPPLNVCVQIKLADEPGKGGVDLQAALSLVTEIEKLPRLRLRGLMTIPPPSDSFQLQLQDFEQLAQLFNELRAAHLSLDTLSMGMSADLEAAIAAGATILRVGTAIFGERTQ